MKRTRSGNTQVAQKSTAASVFRCSYENCKASFSTDRALRVHIKRHRASAPFLCPIHDCTASFASRTRCNAHVTSIHPTGVTKANDLTDAPGSQQGLEPDPDGPVEGSEGEDEETREIADNAKYFASQLRIAQVSFILSLRSYFSFFFLWLRWRYVQCAISLLTLRVRDGDLRDQE